MLGKSQNSSGVNSPYWECVSDSSVKDSQGWEGENEEVIKN